MPDPSTFRWVAIGLGVVYLGLAITMTLSVAGVFFCPFRWTVTKEYRDGGGGSDDLQWRDTTSTARTNQYTVGLLITIALYWESLFLIIFHAAPGLWSDLQLQIEENFNRWRWLRMGVSHPLMYVVVAMVAGVTNEWLLASLGVVVAFGLSLNQSLNESYHSRRVSLLQDRGGAPREKRRLPWAERQRADEAWYYATAVFLFIVIMFSFHYANAVGAGPSTAVATLRAFLWISFIVVYFILHMAIFLSLTNRVVKTWAINDYSREYFFEIVQFVLHALIFFTVLFGLNTDAANCPK